MAETKTAKTKTAKTAKPAKPAPLATKTTAATVAETTGTARKGIPGLRLYSTVFPGVLAEIGKPVSLSGLFDLAKPRVEGSGPEGRAYVEDGSLLSRVRSFFREIANRARGVPSTKPFPVPGRAGGIVFGPRSANGDVTLLYSATAERVEAPPLAGSEAPAKSAKPAKTKTK